MTELVGALWLCAGLAALAVAAGLATCCLRIRSPLEYLLAAYTLAWAWLVAVTLALSPPGLVTRGWLSVGIGAGLLAALAGWGRLGRPPPPDFARAIDQVRLALRRRVLLLLAAAVTLGVAYTAALAFLTPVNDGDALAYHVARAAFWNQEDGVGYVDALTDPRLDVNPPNAEIGQLATILLSGVDRYVVLPQFLAYCALILGVAALSRRIGLSVQQALFSALAFATLPIVVVQASSALNDLVVAAFLVTSVVFALRPGRVSLVLLALALGLALGTKFTAVLALPTLALVVAAGRRPREWPGLAAAGVAGAALGATWYVVNLVETGEPDGGLAEAGEQRVGLSLPSMATTAMRLILDVVDMSGAPPPYLFLFPLAALVILALGLVGFRQARERTLAFAAAAAIVASVYFFQEIGDFGQRGVYKAWLKLGKPETTSFDIYWGLNGEADATDSWYGPLGVFVLTVGALSAAYLWFKRRVPLIALALALAPWAFLLTLAATIVWDPWRGRFLVFGVALAAAFWGRLFPARIVVATTAALGVVTLFLALANHQGKPSGFGELWPRSHAHHVSVRSIWADDSRWETQVRLRAGEGDAVLLRFIDEQLPVDASVALVPVGNDALSPLFGPRLSRRVTTVPAGERVPADVDWLFLTPGTLARRCPMSWLAEVDHETGWRIERRVAPDNCLS